MFSASIITGLITGPVEYRNTKELVQRCFPNQAVTRQSRERQRTIRTGQWRSNEGAAHEANLRGQQSLFRRH